MSTPIPRGSIVSLRRRLGVLSLTAPILLAAGSRQAVAGDGGACCLPDGACITGSQETCEGMGGDFQGPGAACSGAQACCLGEGACVMVDPLCCEARGGRPQGPESACSLPRACCLGDGVCVELDPLCCTELGGAILVHGTGTKLGTNLCTGDYTSCCLENGLCVKADRACCLEIGGRPTSGVCTPPQACCLPDGSCVDLSPICCREGGGVSQGAGSSCAEADCTNPSQGCSPTFWRLPPNFQHWPPPYDPGDLFSMTSAGGVFFEDAFAGKTLLMVLRKGGPGLDALGRHTVAALLNAASPEVNYPLAPVEVVELFNEAYPDGDIAGALETLEAFNAGACPFGPPPGPPPAPGPSVPDVPVDSPGKFDDSGRGASDPLAPQDGPGIGAEACSVGLAATLPLMLFGWTWFRRRRSRAVA